MSIASQRDRLFDLLADRALVGLEPSEDEELARLLVDFPDAEAIAEQIELAAAAIAIAGTSERGIERMPSALFHRIEEAAQDGMPTTIHRQPDLRAGAAATNAKTTNLTATVLGPPTNLAATLPAPQASAAPGPGTLDKPSLKQTMPMPPPANPASSVPPIVPTTGPQAPPGRAQLQQAPSPPYQQRPASSPLPMMPAFAQQQHPQQPAQSARPLPPPAQVLPLRAPAAQDRPEQDRARGGRGAVLAMTGWLAAAACLLLAVGAWYFRPRVQIVTVTEPAPPPTAPPSAVPPRAPPTPEQEREALLARADTARVAWAKNATDPASKEATGDVVWNATEQRGYMRFRGLAKNDRSTSVYQLWIFDKTRDDKYPVDGGVFDIDDETGDVIVPIKATLPVGEIALFAVTVEKPGGVVVSKRERIVVTAKPAT